MKRLRPPPWLGKLIVLLVLSGCTLSNTAIRSGTPITQIQRDYGLPDVLSDQSGDAERYYVPTNRPNEEWPWEAPRTFYYLDRNIFVTFVKGKAVRAGPIPNETREVILTPLVESHKGSSNAQPKP